MLAKPRLARHAPSLAPPLTPAASHVALESRPVVTRRIARRLRRRGLVGASPHLVGGAGGGSAHLVYNLTEAGRRLAGALDPGLRDRPIPPRSHLFVDHALMTADIAVAFHRAARTHPGHDVAEWESDWEAAARLRSGRLVPDGFVVYATPMWELSAFVEADLGTERPSRFAQKIADYVDTYRARRWSERLSAWPLVLTVTHTAARATALRRVSEDVLERQNDRASLSAVEFDFAALADLQGPRGPLGEIWQIAGRPGLHALIAVDAPNGSSVPARNRDHQATNAIKPGSMPSGSASREGDECAPYQHPSGAPPT